MHFKFTDKRNDATWRDAFNSMFDAIDLRDCTPESVYQTMRNMPRTSNRLDDITIACRSRNIAASDDDVLSCLRQLFKDGKIGFRELAGRQFFITK